MALIESADRLLARVSAAPLSRFLEAEHQAQGVSIRLKSNVQTLEHAEGRVTGVRLTDGEILPAAGVIVGIGIIPNAEPLLAAGAEGEDGVAVDVRPHESGSCLGRR